jgi:hypothetical protein
MEKVVASGAAKYNDAEREGYDIYIDVRALPDPVTQPQFAELNGKDKDVQDWIKLEIERRRKMNGWKELLEELKGYVKRHPRVIFYCFSGKYRSVALAEIVAEEIENEGGEKPQIIHYQVGTSPGADSPPSGASVGGGSDKKGIKCFVTENYTIVKEERPFQVELKLPSLEKRRKRGGEDGGGKSIFIF